MGYVIFGHGGLDPASTAKMEICALGAGTTLQFFTDAGQSLIHAPADVVAFETLERPWGAIDSTGVTYNLALEGLGQKLLDAYAGVNWGGHTVLTVDTGLGCEPQMCTGDETTCPKDPRMVAGTVPGPTAHGCEGILARYAGQELYWVACAVIDGFDEETMAAVRAARGDAPAGVQIGLDPDDPVPTALAFLHDAPDQFEDYFNALDERERELVLRDPEIAEWKATH
jgi:hypothetical protein